MPERERTSEELLSELLIANHNLESCLRKMQVSIDIVCKHYLNTSPIPLNRKTERIPRT